MNSLDLKSPAKVNLRLEVLKKRDDGYHDLRMVMSRISLFDDITITLNNNDRITLNCDKRSVPLGKENIAWQAANLFKETTGLEKGIDIYIKKKIPMGGGLGGGSSNAATVLMGLNKLTGDSISRNNLLNMGLKLGADVPFFIFEGPALAEGIGEKLSLITDLPKLWFVLVTPAIEISTGSVFNALNLLLTKNNENLNITRFNFSILKVVEILRNDLESVTLNKYPEVRKIKETLQDCGSAGVLMSGSGATVFSLYRSEEEAKKAFGRIREEKASKDWFVFIANSF